MSSLSERIERVYRENLDALFRSKPFRFHKSVCEFVASNYQNETGSCAYDDAALYIDNHDQDPIEAVLSPLRKDDEHYEEIRKKVSMKFMLFIRNYIFEHHMNSFRSMLVKILVDVAGVEESIALEMLDKHDGDLTLVILELETKSETKTTIESEQVVED